MKSETGSRPVARSLGIRLVLATLVFCFLFTVAAVAVRSFSAWQDALSEMDSDLAQIEQLYRLTLSKAIWEVDREALQAHLEGVATIASVGRIEITVRSINRPPEVLVRVSDGWAPSSNTPARSVSLDYEPFPGGRETVGQLMLAGDERVLRERLSQSMREIVLTQALQSLLLAGLIMLMFNRSVTVHVQQVAHHLARLTPDRLGVPLRLARSGKARDELGMLESGVNALQGNLSDHLAQLRRYEGELADHRDRLAELVQARTSELESLTESQSLVLTLSNRLIHAPYERFDESLRSCLQEVAQRLAASDALWFFPGIRGEALPVFLQWHDPVPDEHRQLLLVRWATRLSHGFGEQDLTLYSRRAEATRQFSLEEVVAFQSLPIGACALARLCSGEEDFGFLFFGRPDHAGVWNPQDRALLALAAQMFLHSARHKAQLLELLAARDALREANRQLEDLSRHDPLTGLYNRRHFDEVRQDEYRRALRNGLPLSLLICDIDCFKGYNDHNGHASGDECLRAVAGAMLASLPRSGDLLARIGGEEFAVLLPATSRFDALKVAERIRRAVEALAIPHPASCVGSAVTVSVGAAQLDPDEDAGFDALFEAADQALYKAKELGRNRVEVAEVATVVNPFPAS